MRRIMTCLLVATLALMSSMAFAQEPTPYGAPINLETARKVLAAAEAEAVKQKWPVAIAVLDSAGYLVAFHRLDNTQLGSIEVAMEKAKTAVLYRRPTKVFEDRLAAGGGDVKLLKLPGLPLEGGIPIIQGGNIIGAIGVSGVQSTQDAQVATAGTKAVE